MKSGFILALILSVLPLITVAQKEPCACSVEAALNEFLAGASRNHAAAHDRFWAEELIYTSSTGERFGKQAIMAGFGDAQTTPPSENAPLYSATDVDIRFENGLALLTFTLVGKTAVDNGTTVRRYYNSGVLKNSAPENQSPHWQAVLWQATTIPECIPDDVVQQ